MEQSRVISTYIIVLGEFVNEEGEMVIDEEEYELISQLNELKKAYRYETFKIYNNDSFTLLFVNLHV